MRVNNSNNPSQVETLRNYYELLRKTPRLAGLLSGEC